MKKMMCIALVFVLLFAVAACGSKQGEQFPNTRKPETNANTPGQFNAEPEEAKEPAKAQAAEKGEVQAEIRPIEPIPESTEQEAAKMKMKIQVGDTVFTATLAENSSVDGLKELMADGPLTFNMSDYANMEKGADLGVALPQNNEQMNTQAGDIILYQGRTFVIYYDTNSWSLTPIGKIDNVDAEKLKAALGTGDVTVTLSLE